MTTTELLELENICLQYATNKHVGQVDKAGMPYIRHPVRVGESCFDYLNTVNNFEFAVKCRCVALLHDVLEDTNTSIQDLVDADIPQNVINGIISVTRNENESYGDFVKRAALNEYGKYVKFFDLKDNLDVTRLKKNY